ncbi:toprim domain-containing protein [Algoriphagus sp. D3-2-R+10]|uniref:toprim domain-containing protein n=1 Tax=Algoriphagus aurantiacus TaxID=3103948 RepID=UPI002B398928|nr:toprim domain-containing protein [Algoriphagus sp. D3-2-R+10]MEB2774552.1 toprim domain-containing protein [Algoriphagus sp. D3-2-R+10]
MFNYSEVKREAERIKQEFPIVDYFQSLVNSGFLKYEGIQGKEHFFGFLNQRTGSIAVDDRANVWYDHSAGRGGDIIEAVQVFENQTFPQSVERLSGLSPESVIVSKKKPKPIPKIEIESVEEISHLALVNYVRTRGLDPSEIAPFAKEVHWRNKGKSYFAVGFPNESGGWVLRSSIFKGNILGGGVSIQILGKLKRIKIFEGWFDFFSYLKLSGATDFKAIILNSTANLTLRLMLDILKECEAVDLYLDNDGTGDHCTSNFIRVAQLYNYCLENGLDSDWDLKALRGSRDKVGKLLSDLEIKSSKKKEILKIQTRVSDQRGHFTGFEDVNAFLMGTSKSKYIQLSCDR